MTKLNFERRGPPRPGSGLNHPFGGERPYVAPKSDAGRKLDKARELAAEEAREAELARERSRQARRDARNSLKRGLPSFMARYLAKIPKPPNTQS